MTNIQNIIASVTLSHFISRYLFTSELYQASEDYRQSQDNI